MRLVGLLEAGLNYRAEALEFQQLVIDNKYLNDCDASIELNGHDQYYVHVKHPELMDLTFHVNDSFSVDTRSLPANGKAGRTAKEAIAKAFPLMIGVKAAVELYDTSGVDETRPSVEDDTVKSGLSTTPRPRMTALHLSGTSLNSAFRSSQTSITRAQLSICASRRSQAWSTMSSQTTSAKLLNIRI